MVVLDERAMLVRAGHPGVARGPSCIMPPKKDHGQAVMTGRRCRQQTVGYQTPTNWSPRRGPGSFLHHAAEEGSRASRDDWAMGTVTVTTEAPVPAASPALLLPSLDSLLPHNRRTMSTPLDMTAPTFVD